MILMGNVPKYKDICIYQSYIEARISSLSVCLKFIADVELWFYYFKITYNVINLMK